jgi:hypothetical protein
MIHLRESRLGDLYPRSHQRKIEALLQCVPVPDKWQTCGSPAQIRPALGQGRDWLIDILRSASIDNIQVVSYSRRPVCNPGCASHNDVFDIALPERRNKGRKIGHSRPRLRASRPARRSSSAKRATAINIGSGRSGSCHCNACTRASRRPTSFRIANHVWELADLLAGQN